jgi:hypothetical protein
MKGNFGCKKFSFTSGNKLAQKSNRPVVQDSEGWAASSEYLDVTFTRVTKIC